MLTILTTGLFFHVLPNKTMSFKSEKCYDGRSLKQRLTVLLCYNVEGDFEMPVVINESRKARYFKYTSSNSLRVQLKSNEKAWMSSDNNKRVDCIRQTSMMWPSQNFLRHNGTIM